MWVEARPMARYDYARQKREKIAGVGFSYYHKRFTLSGIVGVLLVERGQLDVGKPIGQIRIDLTVL